MTNGRRAYVLDLSRPSNNTLDNYSTLVHFIDRYKPTHVLWAYNINDILGPLTLPAETTSMHDSVDSETKVDLVPATRKGKSSFRAFVDGIYRRLPSIEYFSYKLQTILRGYGIILPIGDFHYLVNAAYEQNSRTWRDTRALFSSAAQLAERRGSVHVIVYLLPEFNLLSRADLFYLMNLAFSQLSTKNPHLNIVDGHPDYPLTQADALMLSKYDGHPSGLAHHIMAQRWFDLIINTP